MHIVLVGPMAVGKSTVGRGVAEHLGRPLRDSDDDLVAARGINAAELASSEGVPALHRWEAAHLRHALISPVPAVIAAAASVVDDEACRTALRDPFVVWLRAPTEVLADRVTSTGHRRHLDVAHAEAQVLAARRDPRYSEVADAVVDVDSRPPDAVLADVLAAVPETG